ncbi:MAG TPA: hypothetical protein VF571_15165 [Pyrinomonadaceae bacterium]|jgi:hypothetical protein
MAEFVTCKHCDETGTCKNRLDGSSCARCRAYWVSAIKNYQPQETESGLVCSVCWGKGVTEPTSTKWQNRFTPILASVFVVFAFVLIAGFGIWAEVGSFDKVLVFASTLIGSITGYYFGGERAAGREVATIKKIPIEKPNAGSLNPANQSQLAGANIASGEPKTTP